MVNTYIYNLMDINPFCKSCGKRFSSSYDKVGMHSKCGHFIHTNNKCLNPKCNICDAYCGPILPVEMLSPNTQNHTNALSIVRIKPKFTWYDRFNGLWRILKSLPIFIGLYWRLCFSQIDINYLQWLNMYLIQLLNINVMSDINSVEKLNDNSYRRIIIANHTNYHDLPIVASLLYKNNVFGFVSAPTINTNLFGRAITKIIPHVMIENNTTEKMSKYDKKYVSLNYSSKSGSNYDKIKNYFNKYPHESKLIICPEGMLSNHLTLSKFRSTAFNLGYPVQPVIIKYEQPIYDLLGFNIFCYPKIDVEVKVLDPIETDGTPESIELIRKKMADKGNLLLSDVINKIM
jgi:1-acyl-sn-glycerol-3-phosphate acyltransferase